MADTDETDHRQTGNPSDPALRAALQERNKELSFLHHATRLLDMNGEPRDILRAVLELLPVAFQHPELAGARLEVGALQITTGGEDGGEGAAFTLRAELDVPAERSGFIEVWYTQPPTTEPVFLEEERSLLTSAAQLVKGYLERNQADAVYQRLLQAEAGQEEALSQNKAKDQFLSTVSHELRSSLHVMLGWIQVLRQGAAPDVLNRGLQILERNVTLQAKLIEDLMDLSRIVSGKLELDRRNLDLTELIGFAVDATRPAAEAKQVELRAELEVVGDVLGDQQRLQQVIYNVLGNAVKFTPAGGRIRVALRRTGERASIVVADSGPGIDEQLLPHVFERFRQADSAKKGRGSGLGLGLPIARHLVELHGGTIAARSHPPEPGTTFEIVLPLQA